MNEEKFQLLVLGGLGLLLLLILFVAAATVGGERKTVSTKAPDGKDIHRNEFYLFGKRILKW